MALGKIARARSLPQTKNRGQQLTDTKFARDAADLGTFMAHPVSVADVAQAVGRLLVEC
jgi:hypothetical protein